MADRPHTTKGGGDATHRMTPQRQAVLDVLRERFDHPTADEVFVRVRSRMPRVSLATVYRNLDVLADQGQIQVIKFPSQPRRYDASLGHHYHILCVSCGEVEDVHLDRIPDLATMVARTGAYEVLATRLEFEGICQKCRAARSSSNG